MPVFPITDVASIYRLTRSGNNEAYDPTPVATNIDCGVFPAGTDVLAVYPGEPSYQLYDIYIYEPCTIKNGDKLVTQNQTFIVRGEPLVMDNRYMYYQRLVGERKV